MNNNDVKLHIDELCSQTIANDNDVYSHIVSTSVSSLQCGILVRV